MRSLSAAKTGQPETHKEAGSLSRFEHVLVRYRNTGGVSQYRSVGTWEKRRDEVAHLREVEFLEAIGNYDGLGPAELAKLHLEHTAILDHLDRSLRALDGKLGRTEQNGPRVGERGAALSDYEFVTKSLRIQRVSVRAEPDGPLFRFGQEWLPEASGYLLSALFSSKDLAIPDMPREGPLGF